MISNFADVVIDEIYEIFSLDDEARGDRDFQTYFLMRCVMSKLSADSFSKYINERVDFLTKKTTNGRFPLSALYDLDAELKDSRFVTDVTEILVTQSSGKLLLLNGLLTGELLSFEKFFSLKANDHYINNSGHIYTPDTDSLIRQTLMGRFKRTLLSVYPIQIAKNAIKKLISR